MKSSPSRISYKSLSSVKENSKLQGIHKDCKRKEVEQKRAARLRQKFTTQDIPNRDLPKKKKHLINLKMLNNINNQSMPILELPANEINEFDEYISVTQEDNYGQFEQTRTMAQEEKKNALGKRAIS